MHVVHAIFAGLLHAIRWIVIASFAVMGTAAIAQVIFRYFLHFPLGWTDELARIMMVWWVFLCVAVLASQRRLLAVDALLLVLPARGQAFLLAFVHLLSAAFVAWLAWLGVRLVGLAGTQTSVALEIPYAWIYASLPTGIGLAALYFLLNGVADLYRALTARGLREMQEARGLASEDLE
jgi:TRAP-type C4-dicarboxylate transport system permease small subunit